MKTIPSLNKIKLLSKIAPPLSPSFRHATSHRRGAVIAVDGQDPAAVGAAVDYLNTALKKEEKYHVRVFEGPAICPSDERSESEDPVDYLDIFKKWQHVSNEIVSFVKSPSDDTKSTSDDGSSGISPKTITQTENLQIDSPAPSSENGVGATPSPARSNPSLLPIALVPPYQLTTTDTLACMMPIDDAYSPLDHWQWMASLWRGRVGPDITVYIRECEKEEMGRVGGNVVEVRLQDARAIVVRRAAGSSGLEEKILKRVGFELEDFLAQ